MQGTTYNYTWNSTLGQDSNLTLFNISAWNGLGQSSDSSDANFTIDNPDIPIATLNANNTTPEINHEVAFDASGSHDNGDMWRIPAGAVRDQCVVTIEGDVFDGQLVYSLALVG